ncbi:MAG: RNA 2',3'-cyclic phosphodiesterase [Caldithrix sp.]|nr:RNA 2',3'-cyclic phosphodiesterase [Caldithrix sp.]
MDEATIRCFLAINLPEKLKQSIAEYQQELKRLAPKVKWVKPQSIHITVKFLGNQPESVVDKVIANLHSLGDHARRFQLNIAGFGAFPSRNKPRVLWIGGSGQPHEHLYDMYRWIEEHLQPLGFEKEKKRFSPHLTLGRVKFPQNLDDLWAFVQENPFPPYSFEVQRVELMRSQLKPDGARYSVLHRFAF